jgi:hypothetical protein
MLAYFLGMTLANAYRKAQGIAPFQSAPRGILAK